MLTNTPSTPTAEAAALALVGRRFIGSAEFLTAFLQRLGVSTERSEFLQNHEDQVGAWVNHLKDYRLCERRMRNRAEVGDVFLQRLGPRKDWRVCIVTRTRRAHNYTAPAYPLSLVDGYVTLFKGRVLERIGSLPIEGATCPVMLRFSRTSEVVA
ncbi:MAG: hypothetical protein GYB49_09375 [Alphaproteobacteria bacterium]|nr:hypothetical protein [Hyphomonas sp.]MBR9807419.1 hypothetical protein [Alphaproteobacteria bacterium]|tara:strand:+ start:2845 stop:3309 length:465 start_codon:yes stop_codon:yes gene_type:complete